MSEEAKNLLVGLQGFADEMKAKGIHVGLGADPRCVTCGEAWPCASAGGSPR